MTGPIVRDREAHAGSTSLQSDERHRLILEGVRGYAIFTTDCEGRIETWPPGAETVYGWTAAEAIGGNAAITFVPEDREQGVHADEMAEAEKHGSAPNVRWHIRKDGRRVFIEGSIRLIEGRGSEPHRYLWIGQDVTERRRLDERQQVLIDELQHRTRNLMGVVRSMFDRTLRGSDGLDELAALYRDRITALARVQGLLSQLDSGNRIAFDELIRVELSAIGVVDAQGFGERVTLDGPSGVRLRSSTLQTFALALHELATNASKHGAFARPAGRLCVRWRLLPGDSPRLRIEWLESGVDALAQGEPAKGSGYGRELIEQALPYQLSAETTYEIGADGVRCTIEMPVSDSTKRSGRQDG